jgi:hypothetical protein
MENDDLVKVLEATEGTSISTQLGNLFDGYSKDDQNPNALEIITRFLKRYAKKYNNEEWANLADKITDYLKKLEE